MDAAFEVAARIDDCCHRAVYKSFKVGTTVQLHRDTGTTEYQHSPTVTITVEKSDAGPLIVKTDPISSEEQLLLDFVLKPVHMPIDKGFMGPPRHYVAQVGERFELKSQTRNRNGNRTRQNRIHRDPDQHRYNPPSVSGSPVVLRSRAQMGLRQLIHKPKRPRTKARNVLDEPVPVIIPDVETSSDSEADSEAADQ